MNVWAWRYMNDPYGWSGYPKIINIRAKTKDDAIWKLYKYVVKKFGTFLSEEYDTYGLYILFHADIYYGSFNSYNLEKVTKEHFIKEFKSQVEENKEFFSLEETEII